MSHKPKSAGRGASRIVQILRSRIATGDIRVGEYLPAVRDVGRRYGVSFETARRAMKALEAEHLVRVHSRHGFLVTARAHDPHRNAPVAFILSSQDTAGKWGGFADTLVAALCGAAEDRGWSMLAVAASGRSPTEIVEQLKSARASGLLLDTLDEPLIEALRQLGMPAVMVEEPARASGLDCVSQDNFGGAEAAARFLVSRGHRRIGWLGPLAPTPQSRERWGGVQSVLRESKATMAAGHVVDLLTPRDRLNKKLRRVLAGHDHPTAVAALWWPGAVLLLRLARELGMVTPDDLEVVTWCPQEQLPEFAAMLADLAMPATVTWSTRQLAEVALDRIAERRKAPDRPPVRISVQTSLQCPQGGLWPQPKL